MLRLRLENADLHPQLRLHAETLRSVDDLNSYYQNRHYRLLWTVSAGPVEGANVVINLIQRADDEGLDPSDYHLEALKALHQKIQNQNPSHPSDVIDYELLLSDALFLYGSHLLNGRINARTLDPEWIPARRERNLPQLFTDADSPRLLREAVESLLPDHSGYRELKTALSRYRSIARKGGWTPIPPGPVLKPGQSHEQVPLIRKRISREGFAVQIPEEPTRKYDEELVGFVRTFQEQYGLQPDGIVGPRTREAMNVSAQKRARQIALNLERWRWLPQNLGNPYVLVNIANFRLRVFENEHHRMEMRAIVGRPYRKTPVFSDRIRYLVLNPTWTVPPRLAREDLLPKIQQDPEYLKNLNFTVFESWNSQARVIDLSDVNWSSITPKLLSYRFRQEPGPMNALGQIKFMFPNPFDVYLHDTPNRELFGATRRDFSSGCIRIENPLELAEFLLLTNGQWSRQQLDAALRENKREQTVMLSRTVPVHLLYWTSWVDMNGQVQFREDIYDRDTRLEQALFHSN